MKQVLFVIAAALCVLACGREDVRAQPEAPIEPPVFESSGDEAFDAWRDAFAMRALRDGREREVTIAVLTGLEPNAQIMELDQRQPEFVSPVWDYVTRRLSTQRISSGRTLKAAQGEMLAAVEARYGVDANIILGIWGLETNFGEAPLNYGAAEALATLAFEGRRRDVFERYLLSLIELVEHGYASAGELQASWAGALGQPQFMPDVYLTTAVDWDEDGKRDIWTNQGDVAASIAHYLSDRGWQAGEPVFQEVRLPDGFDYSLADGSSRRVSALAGAGAARIDGAPWSAEELNHSAQLFLPAGAQGPALLLYPNFAVIRRYNPSDRYALVVALLARSFANEGGLVRAWPTHLGALNRDETLELQTLLNGLGYDAGAPDGLFGSNTRRAVRAFQSAEGAPADGYPTSALLSSVRERAGVAPPPPPRPLDRAGIRELQGLLNNLGFDAGAADGLIGGKTRAAIRSFQRSRGMDVTGRATTNVLAAAQRAAQ